MTVRDAYKNPVELAVVLGILEVLEVRLLLPRDSCIKTYNMQKHYATRNYAS